MILIPVYKIGFRPLNFYDIIEYKQQGCS